LNTHWHTNARRDARGDASPRAAGAPPASQKGAALAARVAALTARALADLRASSACFAGLDVSLASTGLVVLDARGRCVLAASAGTRTRGAASVLDAGAAVSRLLARAARAHRVRATVVEDFVQTFAAGGSSAHTRFALARVNGVAAYEAWRHTRAPVLYAHAASMRAHFGLERAPRAPRAGGGAGAGAPGEAPDAGEIDAALAARAASRARVASRAAAKAGVVSFVTAAHPELLAPSWPRVAGGGAGGAGDAGGGAPARDVTDRADAALAAMFCLAGEVQSAVLAADGGAAFWAVVDAALPSARVGRGGAAGAAGAPALRAALQRLHAAAMEDEALRRRVPQGDAGDGGEADDGAGAGAGAPPAPPARRRVARGVAAAADAQLPLSVSADALERLYARQRAALAALVTEALMGAGGELAHWRAGAAAL
jgi:hypothetical protein